MRKEKIITMGVIAVILLIAGAIIYSKTGGFGLIGGIVKDNPSEALAKYIGEHSILYVQLGCSACEKQEDLFGANVKYLTIIDCLTDTQSCIIAEIEATPTWIINNEKYVGVQSIERLKELTSYEE